MRTLQNIISSTALSMAALASVSSQAGAADNAASAGNPLGQFLPLIIIFVIFYFFLIRPQQKKAKEHQKLLNAAKKDDRILTAGGIYGTIVAVRGDILEVKIADNVKVQIARSAISTVIPPDAATTLSDTVK